MCESAAYVIDEKGNELLLMESVAYVKIIGDKVLLRSLFGEEKTVDGNISEMNLTAHKITLESR
jgi:predicted RNA-binding protein